MSTNTANTAAREERGLSVVENTPSAAPAFTREQLDALKAMLNSNKYTALTDAQFEVFIAHARHLGLDPFARQIVAIVQEGRMTTQTTIDGFRLIAQRSGQYGGQRGPYWCGKDGVWHDVWLSDDAPVAAKVGVIRRDFDEPMWGVARTKSYRKSTPTWNSMPDVMIAKVAESLALRKAFPAELSGIYTFEEMAQARRDANETEMMIQGLVVDAVDAEDTADTSDATRRTASPSAAAAAPVQRQAPAAQQAKPAAATKAWNGLADKEFRQRMNALGYRTVADVEAFLDWAKGKAEQNGISHHDAAYKGLEMRERDAAAAKKAGTVATAATDTVSDDDACDVDVDVVDVVDGEVMDG